MNHFRNLTNGLKDLIILACRYLIVCIFIGNIIKQNLEHMLVQILNVLILQLNKLVLLDLIRNQQNYNLSVQITHFVFAVADNVEILAISLVRTLELYHTVTDH